VLSMGSRGGHPPQPHSPSAPARAGARVKQKAICESQAEKRSRSYATKAEQTRVASRRAQARVLST